MTQGSQWIPALSVRVRRRVLAASPPAAAPPGPGAADSLRPGHHDSGRLGPGHGKSRQPETLSQVTSHVMDPARGPPLSTQSEDRACHGVPVSTSSERDAPDRRRSAPRCLHFKCRSAPTERLSAVAAIAVTLLTGQPPPPDPTSIPTSFRRSPTRSPGLSRACRRRRRGRPAPGHCDRASPGHPAAVGRRRPGWRQPLPGPSAAIAGSRSTSGGPRLRTRRVGLGNHVTTTLTSGPCALYISAFLEKAQVAGATVTVAPPGAGKSPWHESTLL